MENEEKLGFETASDMEIDFDFEKSKKQIIVKNYISIMEQLIPYYDTLAQAKGLLKSQEEIFQEAHEEFCRAKQENRVDELNCLITPLI